MNCRRPYVGTLEKVFGFSELRDGQEEVIAALMEGRSALAIFPTGGGKSMCYQLPALMLEGTALIVSPLLALMKDQVDRLVAKGVAAARLDSRSMLRNTARSSRDCCAVNGSCSMFPRKSSATRSSASC